jgi:hypothetical protein
MDAPIRLTKDLTLPNDRRIIEFQREGQALDGYALLDQHAPKDGRLVLCWWWEKEGTEHVYMTWQGYPGDEPLMGSTPGPKGEKKTRTTPALARHARKPRRPRITATGEEWWQE